jgi:hypothetical protein
MIDGCHRPLTMETHVPYDIARFTAEREVAFVQVSIPIYMHTWRRCCLEDTVCSFVRQERLQYRASRFESPFHGRHRAV